MTAALSVYILAFRHTNVIVHCKIQLCLLLFTFFTIGPFEEQKMAFKSHSYTLILMENDRYGFPQAFIHSYSLFCF